MKLGIVGHQRSIDQIRKVIEEDYPQTDITEIEFTDIDQIPTLANYLKTEERRLDGLIFTGHIPYEYLNKAMISKTPWTYIERTHSQLTRALLKASWLHRCDILNLSIDSFSRELVEEVYRDIGIAAPLDSVYVPGDVEIDSDLLNRLTAFHMENYVLKNVSVCITGITSIYEYLTDKQIPAIIIDPTDNLIRETVERVIDKHRTKISEDRHIVALSIEIDSGDEISVVNQNEYQVMLSKMKVTEEIYKFAQRIQAAVIETGAKGYQMFSTKNILELETKALKEISVLRRVQEKTRYTVSVGIGYGVTAREAMYNANLGMTKSYKSGGNRAYIVEDGKYIGPVYYRKESGREPEQIDGGYQRIAERSGLSVKRVFSLHCLMEQHKTDTFTSRELSSYLKLSNRSVNRIIVKLTDSGYAAVVGRKVLSTAGRPSRLIRLLIDPEKPDAYQKNIKGVQNEISERK